jgi:molybdopterin/thiamine biosynthesis adenylyltransferase
MAFTDEQVQRYSRHILLKGVGGTGQRTLLESRVLVVGAGGLGSPIALYLAAAGVGHLGIIDPDSVELSNLQRQVIHHTPDVGTAKVTSAAEKIERINPDVDVVQYHDRLTADNILDIIADYDFVVEGTDNFPTKFLVNDACILADKPFNQGGILRFQGQTMTHLPGTASYRCVYRQPPPPGAVPTCSEAGVLGAVAGMLGTIQATEALKYLLGIGDLLVDRILLFDALRMRTRVVKVSPTEWAAPAATNTKITELVEYEQQACDVDLEEQYGGDRSRTAPGVEVESLQTGRPR